MVLKYLVLLFHIITSHAYAQQNAAWVWPAAYASNKNYLENSIYLLQGNFNERWQRLGPSPFAWKNKKLTLVLRLQKLPDAGELIRFFEATAKQWEKQSVIISGMQLDYDCPTKKLPAYNQFLNSLRPKLAPKYSLEITGLATWLEAPHSIPDAAEITFQLYQEKSIHKHLSRYLAKLTTYKKPFKIGLLPAQKIDDIANKFFNGVIRFYGGKLELEKI